MKVRFFLGNAVIDWDVPAEQQGTFNFGALCLHVRSNGFFQDANVHIPYEHMLAIGMDNSVQFAANAPSTVVPQ